jgi:hypothetical protein
MVMDFYPIIHRAANRVKTRRKPTKRAHDAAKASNAWPRIFKRFRPEKKRSRDKRGGESRAVGLGA